MFSLNLNNINRKDTFGSYRTSTYKLNYLELPTGIKIVLNTDLNVGKLDDVLHNIYKVSYITLFGKHESRNKTYSVMSAIFIDALLSI